jgi:ABC-type transporter MlaC component
MMKNNKDNKWKVVEVIADGIRLVKSLKNSLAPEIKEKGLEAVISRLESEVT